VTGGIPFRFLENEHFVKALKLLRPAYSLPSRGYTLTKKLIPEAYDDLQSDIKKAISNAKYVSISTDSWTDVSGNNIMNFVVHTPKPYLYKFVDVSAESESGEFIYERLCEVIEEIGPQKVAGEFIFN